MGRQAFISLVVDLGVWRSCAGGRKIVLAVGKLCFCLVECAGCEIVLVLVVHGNVLKWSLDPTLVRS